MEFLEPKTSSKTSCFFLNDEMFWRCFWKKHWRQYFWRCSSKRKTGWSSPCPRHQPLHCSSRVEVPATKIQAQEPCRAELRSDARDANNTPDHLKEAKFNSVNLCFRPFSDVCAILGSPRGPKWFNLVEILEFGQYFWNLIKILRSFWFFVVLKDFSS